MLMRLPRCIRTTVCLSLGALLLLAIYVSFVLPEQENSLRIFQFSPHHRRPGFPQFPFNTGPPSHNASKTTPSAWVDRAEEVRQAFRHAYSGYQLYAAPGDELRPLSRKPWKDRYNGWGVTTFDSLDTMYMMGLEDEFKSGVELVRATKFNLGLDHHAPFFETVIRYLGGLLSAYTLSQEPILLERADDLATALDPVFNTESGLPAYGVNTVSGHLTAQQNGILAEIGTLQLEYSYLAKLTGKKQWHDRAKHIANTFYNTGLNETGGMLPIKWNLQSGQPSYASLSVGAEADSAHEYLLKQYLLTAKTDKAYLEMYLRATTQALTKLTYISPNRQLVYITDSSMFSAAQPRGFPSHRFEHLSCFFPGLLALGAHTLPLDRLDSMGIDLKKLGEEYGVYKDGYDILSTYNLKDVHMWAAEAIAKTCYLLYADQPTGLAADEVTMVTPKPSSNAVLWIDALQSWRKSGSRGPPPGTGRKQRVTETSAQDYNLRKSDYLLRPETIESLFVMWRVTSDDSWRQMGWELFQAIERSAKTDVAYASLQTVQQYPPVLKDEMPSFFLAETLKYFYLLTQDDDYFDLKEWVFNTEAHPFRIFDWTAEEKKQMGI